MTTTTAIDVTELKLLAAILVGAKLTTINQEFKLDIGEDKPYQNQYLTTAAWRCLQRGYFTLRDGQFEVSDEAKSMLLHMRIESIFTTL